MLQFGWDGVFPALITPFTENDKLDLELFQKNLDAQLDAGIHGIVLAGSLGEASSLEEVEKETLVRTALQKIAGKTA
jgi:1-pyrroline-4-hydroxy-2-carboxylate deaminase